MCRCALPCHMCGGERITSWVSPHLPEVVSNVLHTFEGGALLYHTHGGWGACRSTFCLSPVWVLGLTLGPSGLEASALAISTAWASAFFKSKCRGLNLGPHSPSLPSCFETEPLFICFLCCYLCARACVQRQASWPASIQGFLLFPNSL